MIPQFDAGFHSQTILHVEDDPMVARAVTRAIKQKGFDVVHVASMAEAFIVATTVEWRAAILDLNLGIDSGVDVAIYLRRQSPKLRIVFYSGETDEVILQKARLIAPVVAKSGPIEAVFDLLKLGISPRFQIDLDGPQ